MTRPSPVTRRDGATGPTLSLDADILDLDDTLFDHLTSARNGARVLAEQLELPEATTAADRWNGIGTRLMELQRSGRITTDEYRRRRVQALLKDAGHRGVASEYEDPRHLDDLYERYLRAYESQWTAFPDVLPALRQLHDASRPVAILTNGPEERQRRKVHALGIETLVVSVWTSEYLGTKKPDPTTYRAVCTALGVAPHRALHVGDDLDLDVLGARDAGLRALHLDRYGTGERRDDSVRHVGEILPLTVPQSAPTPP